MQPLFGDNDELLINTARTRPTTGELCALCDGSGLAVRPVKIVHATEPAQFRLTCANPDYAPVTCLADEARNVGSTL